LLNDFLVFGEMLWFWYSLIVEDDSSAELGVLVAGAGEASGAVAEPEEVPAGEVGVGGC
jgi:hypothetical protein